MPRISRQKSQSGIYHIILRGINRREIFHEDKDYRRFLEILAKYTKESETKVHGWCLMNNHVHLLIGEGKEEISATMKRIGVSFAWYYNRKYESTGHLFQDRFKSENVEDDKYLLTVIRYIHQNPLKAGITKRVEDWKWSSCNGYYGSKTYPLGLLDSDLILGMFSAENKELARSRFKEFNEDINNDKCIDYESKLRLTDEEAKQKIIMHIDKIGLEQVKNLSKSERDEILQTVKEIDGITQRQAARILDISPNVIFKA